MGADLDPIRCPTISSAGATCCDGRTGSLPGYHHPDVELLNPSPMPLLRSCGAVTAWEGRRISRGEAAASYLFLGELAFPEGGGSAAPDT